MRESQKMHSTASRAEVPNLGYAYPQGCVRNQGGRQFKILIENVLECLITIHYGVREFSFFFFYALGCAIRKRLGTAELEQLQCPIGIKNMNLPQNIVLCFILSLKNNIFWQKVRNLLFDQKSSLKVCKWLIISLNVLKLNFFNFAKFAKLNFPSVLMGCYFFWPYFLTTHMDNFPCTVVHDLGLMVHGVPVSWSMNSQSRK